MKTRKHGNGLTHADVVRFSNRLAALGYLLDADNAYERGYQDACKHFAHVLRAMLRDVERYE